MGGLVPLRCVRVTHGTRRWEPAHVAVRRRSMRHTGILATLCLVSTVLAGCGTSEVLSTATSATGGPPLIGSDCPDRMSDEIGLVEESSQDTRDRIAAGGNALDALLENYRPENGSWVDRTGRIFVNVTSPGEAPDQTLIDSLGVDVIAVHRAESRDEIVQRAEDLAVSIEAFDELVDSRVAIRWLVKEYCAEVVVNPPSYDDVDRVWSVLEEVEKPASVGLDVTFDSEA